MTSCSLCVSYFFRSGEVADVLLAICAELKIGDKVRVDN